MPSFAIPKFTVLLGPLWVSAVFLLLSTGPLLHLISEFVRVVVGRTGVQIAALEEVTYRNGWINKEQLLLAADTYGKSPYGQHLRNVAEGKY